MLETGVFLVTLQDKFSDSLEKQLDQKCILRLHSISRIGLMLPCHKDIPSECFIFKGLRETSYWWAHLGRDWKTTFLTMCTTSLHPSNYSCFVSPYVAKIGQVHLFGSSSVLIQILSYLGLHPQIHTHYIRLLHRFNLSRIWFLWESDMPQTSSSTKGDFVYWNIWGLSEHSWFLSLDPRGSSSLPFHHRHVLFGPLLKAALNLSFLKHIMFV